MQALKLFSTHPVYRRYWIAMLISNLGNWMQGATQSWLVLSLLGSGEALGTVVALQFLPSLLFSLPAGVLADRLPRRRIVLVCQALMMTLALLTAGLVWSEQIAYWQILLLALMQGSLTAFDLPARQALIVELVSREHYAEAMPLNAFAFNLSRLLGPALAGLCIAGFGMAWTYWLNALSFLPLLLTLLGLSERPAQPKQPGALVSGLRYAFGTPLVRQLLLTLGWVSLFGVNFQTLIPAYARLVLGLEASGYGLLMSSLGLGALAGAIWQIISPKARPGRILKAVLALSLLHLGLWLPLPAAAVGLLWAGCGFAMSTVMINTNTSVQTLIPDALRGRVMAIYSMVLLGTTPIGAWLTGRLFDSFGGRPAAALLGLLTGLGLLGMARLEYPAELSEALES